MKKIGLISGGIILILCGLWFLLRPSHKIWVKLYQPQSDTPVYARFYTSFYFAGDVLPDGANIYLNEKRIASFDSLGIISLNRSGYQTGSVIGLPVQAPAGLEGLQSFHVKVTKGSQTFSSDTMKVFLVGEARSPKIRSDQEITAMRSFFEGAFNDFIIETYNSHVESYWHKPERSAAYRESWEGILNTGLPEEILTPIKEYIDRVQKFIDKSEEVKPEALRLPIAQLNHGLAEEGYPFYTYLYYLHFPLATEIMGVARVEFGDMEVPVLETRQVSRIAGGWTPPTLYGHAASGLAAVSEDLHLATAREFAGCFDGDNIACKGLFGYFFLDLEETVQDEVKKAVFDEMIPADGGEDGKQWQEEELIQISLAPIIRTTIIHEAYHKWEYFNRRQIPETMIRTVRGLGVHPRNKVDIDECLTAERRIMGYLSGWSAEYNAYLMELIHSEGATRFILTFIFSRAHSIYESRALFFELCKAAGILDDPDWILERFKFHQKEWEAAYLRLLKMTPEEIRGYAKKVYEQDFGAPPPKVNYIRP